MGGIQWNAIIKRYNIVRYYINDYRNWGRISIRCWIHKRDPIPCLTGELWGVFCEYLWENWQHYNGTAMYYAVAYIFSFENFLSLLLLLRFFSIFFFHLLILFYSLVGHMVIHPDLIIQKFYSYVSFQSDRVATLLNFSPTLTVHDSMQKWTS